MNSPFDEFTDDLIYSDGHIDPFPGSDTDFKYDDDEYEDYAETIGMVVVEVSER